MIFFYCFKIPYNEEKDPENHLSVKLESEVLENSEDWFTLKLELSEVRAGSNIRYKIYHVDKKKDKIITLAELFVSDDFKESITVIADANLKVILNAVFLLAPL